MVDGRAALDQEALVLGVVDGGLDVLAGERRDGVGSTTTRQH